MESELKMEIMKPPVIDTDTKSHDISAEEVSTGIYVEPEKLKSALRKFDIFFVPVTLMFQVLSSLDNNNVSKSLALQFILLLIIKTDWKC